MSLRDRLENIQNDTLQASIREQQNGTFDNKTYQDLKSRIHRKLLDRVDLAVMESLSPEQLGGELKTLVERLLAEETLAINEVERQNIVRDIQHEVLGLGPLEALLVDQILSLSCFVQIFNQIES